MVDERSKEVGKQNCQHHALRECRVDDTNQDDHQTDQRTEDPLAGIGHGSRHRVSRHKDHAEGKAANHHVPVPRHTEHRVGVGADAVEQQAGGDHADHHASNDAPVGDLGHQQHRTTNEDGQCGHFTHGTLHVAVEGVQPGQAAADYLLDATGSSHAQRGRAGKTVHGSPDRVTRHLRRVGEEQERTAGQRRVEEVLAGTAKHFLADHHTEADTQCDLPQRDARRYDQGKQDGSHEETFVHFMLADGGKYHFPEATDQEGHGVDREEVGSTVDQVIPQARRVKTGKHGNQRQTPVVLSGQQIGVTCVDGVGLKTDVVHPVKNHREGAQPYGNHHALEVETVTHVSSGLGDAARAVEEGINGFVQGIPLFVLAALFEVVLDLVEE